MADITGLVGIIIPSQQDMHCMPYVPERGHSGIDDEKHTAAEQQYEQWCSPDQVAEIDNVLTESFQKDRIGMPKIIIIAMLSSFQFLVIFSNLFLGIKPNFIHCYEN